MHRPAAKTIEKFLSKYPDRELRVVVGYASVYGLAWLAERTQNRKVDLLIGFYGLKNFRNDNTESISAAKRFLRREDVAVRSWFPKEPVRCSVHMKAWHTLDSDNAHRILSGSANLTKHGLLHNREAMGEYYGNEANETMWSMNGIWCSGWNIKPKLISIIEEIETTEKDLGFTVSEPAKKPETSGVKKNFWDKIDSFLERAANKTNRLPKHTRL